MDEELEMILTLLEEIAENTMPKNLCMNGMDTTRSMMSTTMGTTAVRPQEPGRRESVHYQGLQPDSQRTEIPKGTV